MRSRTGLTGCGSHVPSYGGFGEDAHPSIRIDPPMSSTRTVGRASGKLRIAEERARSGHAPAGRGRWNIGARGHGLAARFRLRRPVPFEYAHKKPTAVALMSRWMTWVRSGTSRRRLLVTILGGVLVATIIVWALPLLLTSGTSGTTVAERLKAINDVRGTLIQALAATGLLGGLFYTARTFRLNQQGQVTDRYAKAVEQLGSGSEDVCIGGVYALERIMRDSPHDQPTILNVIVAFIRGHAVRDEEPSEEVSKPPLNVQAALQVIRRRTPVPGEFAIDLSKLNLRRAALAGAMLKQANLRGAELENADFVGAHLEKAQLSGARLKRATLVRTHLEEANLRGAHLEGAILGVAYLMRANLADAHLEGAHLRFAHLEGAHLGGAHLEGADLFGAHLEGANLGSDMTEEATFVDANLEEAELIEANLSGQLELENAHLVKTFFGKPPPAFLANANLDRAHLTRGALTEQQLAEIRQPTRIQWVDSSEIAERSPQAE